MIYGTIGLHLFTFAATLYTDASQLFSWVILLPFLLMLGAGSKTPDTDSSKHTAYLIAAFIAPLLASSISSETDSVELPFQDVVAMAPIEIIGMLASSLGLGILLSIGGKQVKETSGTERDGLGKIVKLPSTNNYNPVKKTVGFFTLAAGLMAGAALFCFISKTGMIEAIKHTNSQ